MRTNLESLKLLNHYIRKFFFLVCESFFLFDSQWLIILLAKMIVVHLGRLPMSVLDFERARLTVLFLLKLKH